MTISKQPSDKNRKAKPATESDYSYAAVQGISKQLEQVGANEATYAEIKDREHQPYHHPTPATKASPKPTEADNDHMYAAVTKKKSLRRSEDMSKSVQAAQISVPPSKPAPYKSETCI